MVKGDALLVVKQVLDIWACKSEKLRAKVKTVHNLLPQFEETQIHHISRKENQAAITLAQRAVEGKMEGEVMIMAATLKSPKFEVDRSKLVRDSSSVQDLILVFSVTGSSFVYWLVFCRLSSLWLLLFKIWNCSEFWFWLVLYFGSDLVLVLIFNSGFGSGSVTGLGFVYWFSSDKIWLVIVTGSILVSGSILIRSGSVLILIVIKKHCIKR
ncbi:hypothetical protein L7F22_047575 [Adiantum nelumboides]|nr:hypothetical protein [Adiantum nelumboides]